MKVLQYMKKNNIGIEVTILTSIIEYDIMGGGFGFGGFGGCGGGFFGFPIFKHIIQTTSQVTATTVMIRRRPWRREPKRQTDFGSDGLNH
jgi:uncharacterized membrane protein